MLFLHIFNFSGNKRPVGQRLGEDNPRLICVHMHFYNFFIIDNDDAVTAHIKKIAQVIDVFLVFPADDKLRTIGELNICCIKTRKISLFPAII